MDSERSRWQVVIDSSSQRKSYVSKKELKIRIEEALSSLGKTTNHEKIMDYYTLHPHIPVKNYLRICIIFNEDKNVPSIC